MILNITTINWKLVTLAIFLLLSGGTYSQKILFGGNIGRFTQEWAIDLDLTSDGSTLISYDASARYWSTYYGLTKMDKNGDFDWNFEFYRKNYDTHEFRVISTVVDDNDNSYSLVYLYQKTYPFQVDGIYSYPGLNLVKLDKNGKVKWVKSLGNTLKEESSFLMYKKGHLYIVSTFEGTISVDNKATLTSNEYYQCYMWMYFKGADYMTAKFDTTGVFINAKSFGEDYPDKLMDAIIDDNENIYISGISDYFGCTEAYSHITKLDSKLDLVWMKQTSKQDSKNAYKNMMYPTNLFLLDNKIYVWASITDVVKNSNFTEYTAHSSFSGGIIIKYDAVSGNYINHKKLDNRTVPFTYGADIKNRYANGYMAAVGGEIYVQTALAGEIILDNNTISSSYNFSNEYKTYCQNNMLIKFDTSTLTIKHVQTFTGKNPSYKDFPGPISSKGNNLYISGTFSEMPLYISGYSILNNSGNGDTDVYFAKLDVATKTGFPGLSMTAPVVFPTIATEFLCVSNDQGVSRYEIYDLMGHKLRTNNYENNRINIRDLSCGAYLIQFYNTNTILGKMKFFKK